MKWQHKEKLNLGFFQKLMDIKIIIKIICCNDTDRIFKRDLKTKEYDILSTNMVPLST